MLELVDVGNVENTPLGSQWGWGMAGERYKSACLSELRSTQVTSISFSTVAGVAKVTN